MSSGLSSTVDKMTVRAFISVDLDRNERIVEFATALKSAEPTLKVVDPSLIHITLKFLGETDERKLPAIAEVLQQSARGISPFTISFKGAGAFPSMNRIRVVWVGVNDVLPLATIAGRLDEGLAELGVTRESRAFAPHITLARARSDAPHPALRQIIHDRDEVDFGTQEIKAVRLKRSVLTRCGPEYHTIEEVVL